LIKNATFITKNIWYKEIYNAKKSWEQAKTANYKLEGSLSTCPQPLIVNAIDLSIRYIAISSFRLDTGMLKGNVSF